MVHIIERHEWDMPQMGPNHETRDLKTIVEANVHHSDTLAPDSHQHCTDAVRSIDHYHRTKGWACIGYHRVICPHGFVYVGRPLTVVPAAAENHNTGIVAYCILQQGNAQANDLQWNSLLEMIDHDERRIHKGLRHPLALKLTTHREVEPSGYTQCPGDGIEHQVQRFRKGQ